MTAETRETYAGLAAAGDVLTAAHFNSLPGGWLGYDGFQASPHAIAASPGTTLFTMTITVQSARLMRISAGAKIAFAGSTVALVVGIPGLNFIDTSSGNGNWSFQALWTPTNGEYTVTFTAMDAGAAANISDGYLVVEDMGPAPV